VPTLRVGMHPVTLRLTKRQTQSVWSCVTTQSVGTINQSGIRYRKLIVPTLRVGMHPVTLRVTNGRRRASGAALPRRASLVSGEKLKGQLEPLQLCGIAP
jgi:hypothetical protein